MRKLKLSYQALALLQVVGLGAVTRADAAGDAGHGGDVYDAECSDCHSLKQGKNKKGPSLFGVVGRKAASVADFSYSDAMKASGSVCTPYQIDSYIAQPKKAVPIGKMKYDGLADAKAREDVLAFLMTVRRFRAQGGRRTPFARPCDPFFLWCFFFLC